METSYCFLMIWSRTYEGNRRWHMGRFVEGTDAEDACDIVRSTLRGGVGDDSAEILEAEWGWDDDIYTDYSYLQITQQ